MSEEIRELVGRIRNELSLECSCPNRYFYLSTESPTASEIKIRFRPQKYARKKAINLFIKLLGANYERRD